MQLLFVVSYSCVIHKVVMRWASKLIILLLQNVTLPTHVFLLEAYLQNMSPLVFLSILTSIFHLSGGQGFGLHADSPKRMPPVHPSSLSCAEDGPKQHLAMILNSISHRWNPSPTDTRCKLLRPKTASDRSYISH
jgi:hypothetical protein